MPTTCFSGLIPGDHPEPNQPYSTHQIQGTGGVAWEGSPEDRKEEEMEASGDPGER